MSLREVLKKLQADIAVLRHPDQDEAVRLLDPVLAAGKLGSIRSHRIDQVLTFAEGIRIVTSYAVRGTIHSQDYFIPSAVVDSEDPVSLMRVVMKEARIDEARARLRRAQEHVVELEIDLKAAEMEDDEEPAQTPAAA